MIVKRMNVGVLLSLVAGAAVCAEIDFTAVTGPVKPDSGSDEKAPFVAVRPGPAHAAALRRHTGIPSLAVSPKNGRLWVTFYGGVTPGEDSNSYVPLMTSADGGRSWKTVCVAEPEKGRRVFDSELWVAPDGRLRWTLTSRACQPVAVDNLKPYAGNEGDVKTDRLMMAELDAEKDPAEMPAFRQVADGVMMCKPIALADGTWLLPVARWRAEPSACFYASTDGGRTFSLRGGVSHFPVENRLYDEQTVVELKNGDLLTFIRAKENPKVVESMSHDGGRTWEVGRKARFEHTSSRHFLRRLKSGNLLLVKNGPIDGDVGRKEMTAYLSTDDGATWRGGLVLDPRDNVSYPDGDQAGDGTIYVTYDHDRLGVQEILLAAFTEDEVLAGKVSRDGSALRGVVISGICVDGKVPAGNVVVKKISGDTVFISRELRDTVGDWFYWAFRAKGAKGRTLTFSFDEKVAWGGPVGVRGPAVTTDGGRTWSYPCDGKSTKNTFSYTFGTDDEVRFYETWQYLPPDWEAFLARHADDRGKKFETGVLCTSRKGRAVPNARFGCLSGKPKYRIFMSSRHHCSEATATPVLEGVAAAFLRDDDLGRWLCANVELMVVPFADYDGVVDGDQGKNRAPHDHNRDYTEFLYPETRAIRDWIASHAGGRLDVFLDVHCPWIRDGSPKDTNEFLYTPWKDPATLPDVTAETRFSELLEQLQCGSMRYRADDDVRFGESWNTAKNYHQGLSAVMWACKSVKGLVVARTYEVPFANARGSVVTPDTCRDLGRDTAKVFHALLTERERMSSDSNNQTIKQPNNSSVDGIYPHLAMSNDEGECGTGAVVPWAGSLWVVTYGPHCPVGSSDKLYQISPDLKRIVRRESVGGTPADRLIHRETNQLLIGPYVIDAAGNVRVVAPSNMPGRLTGAARHLVDPANKVYVATMESGLYELDMRSLAVNTLVREREAKYGRYSDSLSALPAGWRQAPLTQVPGYHGKGLCTGFGRVYLANNGEDSEAARKDAFVTSGALADWSAPGEDWRTIRRCQFTDITTRDGIYGNEHPETNPVWALGWDAKSVILAVATNASAWTYYRLPKASHCYDGAHGWNTEWPRIREAGLGDGNLLATMHGTFWSFPKGFSPKSPNGIRPLSTYLKVIGDFCWWKDAPNGGSIVFGCDDHARSEFLGKRKLKADQPKNVRSTSNLWFVKPEDLTSFGPPTGEGWVWHGEDVKAGELSDPYLWTGYMQREFTFVDAAGRTVPYRLVHQGDWVRVKALADAKGVKAHFVYGVPRPAKLPALNAKRPYIDITDDNGKTFRFPNVNGDTNVLCREVATERDLLYVGGVFYELPAENAGGFACLRPIALADAPVKSVVVDRGLVVISGKRQVLDSLWRNGTAPEAYWLWRDHFREIPK